jgi:FAD:protein FMN transferase
MTAGTEAIKRFECFGSSCAVLVTGSGHAGTPERAVDLVRRRMLGWHRRFSRFEPESELSRLNADPRTRVPVSNTMARLAEAAVWAAVETDGLVDATLVGPIEAAGYVSDLGGSLPPEEAFRLAPTGRPASPGRYRWWRELTVDTDVLAVERPPGLRLDSGGLAKGLFADLAAELLADHECFAVDCGGDLRLGGTSGAKRAVEVASPFGEGILHRYELAYGGVATSGIGRRSWLDRSGAPAHHLLDPSSGKPAFTGVVQATAVAPSALAAETLAKAAVLSGPDGARRSLPHGGVLVFEDRSYDVVEAERLLSGEESR